MPDAGFSLRILLFDGTRDGVQFLEVANWTGLGILIPRERYAAMRVEPELGWTGVYVLEGPDPDEAGSTKLYIGRADQLRTRLDAHARERDWWQSCLCFTTSNNSLTLTQIAFLEAALVNAATEAGLANLENAQAPQIPQLGRADQHDLDRFYEKLLLLSSIVGFPYFEAVESTQTAPVVPAEPTAGPWRYANLELHYAGAGGYHALAVYPAPRQFIIRQGSRARADEVPSCPDGVRTVREKLKAEGVLLPANGGLEFAADHAFNSPSLAAGVVYGGASNGRTAWATDDGRTLNDIDREEIPE